ncbi:MAG: DUF2804 domain-containing protein [Lachnospiraceae bacterium]|nr:DUF2804 domain-containing protein [Lachnospiraceae bacterium]
MQKTYKSWLNGDFESIEKEYTEDTPLLDKDGTVLAKGWARHNVFDYDRDLVKSPLRRKEWDFYQISDGSYMAQISFANISLGGYASAVLVNLKTGKTEANVMSPFIGGRNRYILPKKGDVPGKVSMKVGKALFETETTETMRTLSFSMGRIKCRFKMDIMPGLENITTVLPFTGHPDRYFMTTKQNCMPVEGTFSTGDTVVPFKKDNAFCVLDWGRVCTPYSLVWYWGNGSAFITDSVGKKHLFGFEITWGIGDESNATETAVFYDGKLHKFGPVDVIDFPKPDKYMDPWEFVSKDGRFALTMEPFYDHHTDLNILAMRMHSHQVHGKWNGTVTLDDGTRLQIKDMYAFCEYVENRW